MNIKQLSKKLGLSITTVSRALGGYSDVSKKTKERVKKFAKKYKYSPNLNASRLASNKSNTVGFVLPLYGLNANQLNQSSFFEFIAGMSKKLNNENIHFFMFFANNAEEEKQAYNKLIFVEKVTKIILHNLKTNDDRIKLLTKNKINFVTWGRTKDLKNYSWVDLDNQGSIELIMKNLVEKNHKNICYINIAESYNFAYQRKQGYLKSLKKFNIKYNNKYYITITNEEPKKSANLIKNLLIKNKKITAIICSTEYTAVGAIKACNELNKKIGKDISIVTFDGPVVERITTPALSAIVHPRGQLGIKAVEMLLSMDGDNYKHQNFLAKPKLIDRGTIHKVSK